MAAQFTAPESAGRAALENRPAAARTSFRAGEAKTPRPTAAASKKRSKACKRYCAAHRRAKVCRRPAARKPHENDHGTHVAGIVDAAAAVAG